MVPPEQQTRSRQRTVSTSSEETIRPSTRDLERSIDHHNGDEPPRLNASRFVPNTELAMIFASPSTPESNICFEIRSDLAVMNLWDVQRPIILWPAWLHLAFRSDDSDQSRIQDIALKLQYLTQPLFSAAGFPLEPIPRQYAEMVPIWMKGPWKGPISDSDGGFYFTLDFWVSVPVIAAAKVEIWACKVDAEITFIRGDQSAIHVQDSVNFYALSFAPGDGSGLG